MPWRLLFMFICGALAENISEDDARAFAARANAEFLKKANKAVIAEWNYATNLTEENLQKKLQISKENAIIDKKIAEETKMFPWRSFKNESLKKQFKKFAIMGSSALPEEKLLQFEKIISEMEKIYSTAKICDYKDKSKCNLSLEPELKEILSRSDDPEELKYVWSQWRDLTGKKCKQLFAEYVKLSNEAALLNNFTDTSAAWLDDFDTPTFESDIEQLWKQLEPFYKELHAYVRRQLYNKYGGKVLSTKGPIPAHLLTNMWAQTWEGIYNETRPYKQLKEASVTDALLKQGYTVKKIFELADEFFQSLNFSAMTPTFWEKSVIEKPSNRDIVCHASAWDFFKDDDFRIKMCTEVNENDLQVVHHEMGHIQYFMEYKDQPIAFREGANSGFHEAIGDLMSLSVTSSAHLKVIGLLEPESDTKESTINDLYRKALQKLAFIPFGYLIDKYRWDIFRGKIQPEDYNTEWWKLRGLYQGIEAPLPRSGDDFDAGAKYHVIANVPYIRYFVSNVIQFQFYKAMCVKAGQYDPTIPEKQYLHECDFYKSVEAGNMLRQALQSGSSKRWEVPMEAITGQKKMDAGPLIEYFKPLYEWLQEENKKNGDKPGWTSHKFKRP